MGQNTFHASMGKAKAYRASLGLSKSKPASVKSKSTSKPPRRLMTICPECKTSVRRSRLERHVRKVHAGVKSGQRPPASARPAANVTNAERPKRKNPITSYVGSTAGAELRSSSVPCPVCRKQFATKEMKEHVRTHPDFDASTWIFA